MSEERTIMQSESEETFEITEQERTEQSQIRRICKNRTVT